MSLPEITDRDGWLAARTALLAKEKELTRQRDALNTERRNLPMVEIEKDYVLDGPNGPARLIDLFERRAQLIIYHFMFDPSWEDGCPSCTAGTDELSPGFFEHLHARDTSYAMVSRAPLAKLERWKAKQGWDVPWYSSFGTDFNDDFGVTIDESVAPARYNYRTKAEYEAQGGRPLRHRPALRDAGAQLLPPGRRPRVPHVLAVRAWARVDGRLVLLPRPHRARPPGGVGAAPGPQRIGALGPPRLRLVSTRSARPAGRGSE